MRQEQAMPLEVPGCEEGRTQAHEREEEQETESETPKESRRKS